MAKQLDDMNRAWLAARPNPLATVEVSGALTEVTGFRQRGAVERAKPGDEVIVKFGDRFLIYPTAVAAVMFK